MGRLPRWLWFVLWLLIAVVLIALAALVVHALGGFDLAVHIGDFRFRIGVT
jgi:uncharacterized membrane protein YhaH (DUF805 family)